MSIDLPETIEAEIVSAHGDPLVGILVALDLRYAGRAYYATHLGLTDSTGRARIDREALTQAFAEDQRLFPMDFRIPLSECDANATLRIEGGPQFRQRRAAAIASSLIAPDAAAAWRAATNDKVHGIEATVRLDNADLDGVVRARLTLQRAAI